MSGRLKPGGTLIEATAGNTGLGLALVAGQKGYRLLLVIPDKMSQEKIFHLRAMGAEVVMTRSDVHKGHPEYYQDYAERLAHGDAELAVRESVRQRRRIPRLTKKPRRPRSGSRWITSSTRSIGGVGTGGTMTGLSRYFARVAPHVELVLADPGGVGARRIRADRQARPRRALMAGRRHRRGFGPRRCRTCRA